MTRAGKTWRSGNRTFTVLANGHVLSRSVRSAAEIGPRDYAGLEDELGAGATVAEIARFTGISGRAVAHQRRKARGKIGS